MAALYDHDQQAIFVCRGMNANDLFCELSKALAQAELALTGDEYIPENILVYIAVHQSHRGKGLGKKLMEYTLENCKGDIALHVEADNPAKHLYEKFGFKIPYLEMRLKR